MRWVALAVFAWLALLIGRGQEVFFDRPIRDAVHAHASPLWTTVFKAATFVGSPQIFWLAVVITIALAWRHHRRDMLRLGAVMAGAAVLEIGLKLAFHRTRPSPFFDVGLPSSYSFPSGHALYAMCLYGTLAALLAGLTVGRRLVVYPLAALMIASIGFSRIYLGVHYPSDVLAGWAIGWFWTRTALVYRA